MRSFLLFCVLVFQVPFALAWQGVVDQVVDGDSLKIRHESGRVYNVQLYGVRTPQLSQPSGLEAKEAARKLVEGKSVNVQVINVNPNGSTVAVIAINDQYSLQAFLVGSGMAWVYDGHCDLKMCTQWNAMEQQARTAERGLWKDANPVAPWKWRAGTRKTASAKNKTAARRKKPVRRKKAVAKPAVQKKSASDISVDEQLK